MGHILHAFKFIGEQFEENGPFVGLCAAIGAGVAVLIASHISGTDPACQGTTPSGLSPCLFDADKVEHGLTLLASLLLAGAFVGSFAGSLALDAWNSRAK